MLDLNFIREHPIEIQRACLTKNVKIEVNDIIKLDEIRRGLIIQIEELYARRNKISKLGKKAQTEGLEIKENLKKLEPKLTKTTQELNNLLLKLPNPPRPDVPVGKDGSQNLIIKKSGRPTLFSYSPLDHVALGKHLDIIDLEAGAKVSGSRFYYLKNEAVVLEFALINLAIRTLREEKFTPVLPPILVKKESMAAMGYLEHGGDQEIYYLPKDDLYLIGTSEQSLGPYHQNEIIDVKKLPLRYFAFSTCFRREAGSYGKDTKGILRVHQFDKLEMFSFTLPENSDSEHEYLLSLEEKLMQSLHIPYQVVKMCTGDLGLPAARKYDIEAWIPSEKKYRETHSTSTCTDFQARRLNVKYRRNQNTGFVHTLNGTYFAIGRLLVAILENFQQKDGSVLIPEVLREFTGFSKIKPKKS